MQNDDLSCRFAHQNLSSHPDNQGIQTTIMRLLTHNMMRNNSAAAEGKGFPLKITATEIRVDQDDAADAQRQVALVKGVLDSLDWPALVQVQYYMILCIIAYVNASLIVVCSI